MKRRYNAEMGVTRGRGYYSPSLRVTCLRVIFRVVKLFHIVYHGVNFDGLG